MPRPSVPGVDAVVEPAPVPTVPQVVQEKQAREEADRRSVLVRLLPWTVPLLLALAVPLTKLARRIGPAPAWAGIGPDGGGLGRAVDRARDLGIPVKVHTSRPAQARVLARAGSLSRQGDDGVFAEPEPSEEAVNAYWEQVTRERRQLAGSQPIRRRLWAPFNPVTLVRRPGAD